jgi:protein O-GlcNAc transferase
MSPAELEELLRGAQESHRSGRLQEAHSSYLRLVESAPANPDLWHLLGVIAYQQGDAAGAIAHYRNALALRAEFPQARNNLALALKAAGDLEGAEREFAAVLAARPDYAEASYNLALLHEAAGDNAGAEQAYRQALAQRPDWFELLSNFGNLLRRLHRAGEAEPFLQRAIALRPEDATALGNLALLRIEQDRFAEALSLAQAACTRAPEAAMWWEAAGSAARLAQDADAAVALLERATNLSSEDAGAWFELGLAREACGDDAGAADALAKARKLAPRWERLRWAEALLLPALARDDASAARSLQRFDRGLERLETELDLDSPESGEAALDAASSTLPFHLHYLPGDHTQRQRRFADLVSRSVRAALPSLASPPARRAPARRLRVGFVSAYLRWHVVARFFADLITGLPAADFERWAWLTSNTSDAWTGDIAARVEHFEVAGESLPRIAQRIRDARLDVLVYPDIGLDPQQHALASLRLAPVQAALYGHPVTSGLDSIDYFVSGELLELPGSEAQYRETLVRLPGLGAQPCAPDAPGDGRWAQALRSGNRPLLVCAQNLSKIPPGFDATLAEILSRSAASVIFFDRGAALTRRFLDRLRARGIDASAVHVEAVRPYADFLAGLAAADLILDTPGFSGGGTSLDALGLGSPVLAFEGNSTRSRQTSAMLRLIEVPELIAADGTDYAQRAIALLADGDGRAALRRRILERSHLLFDDPRPLAGFTAFLREAAGGGSVRHSAR